MQRRALGDTGLTISILGYGAAPFGGDFGPVDRAEARRSVRRAIDLGINYFDTAPLYGRTVSETILGEALDGMRDQVVLSTKVGRYGRDEFDYRPASVLRGLDESLSRLRTDRVDIALVHDIEFGDLGPIFAETVPALHEAKRAGKVGAVGVSGLPLAALERAVAEAPLDLILSYCHYHLFDATLMDRLAPMAEARGIGLIGAAPLAMGLLSRTAVLPPWHPAPEVIRAACRAAAEVCAEAGEDIARVALRFATETPRVATTLIGMSNVAEVEANVAAMSRPVDEGLLRKVAETLDPIRGMTWPSGNW